MIKKFLDLGQQPLANSYLNIPSIDINWYKTKRMIKHNYGVYVDDTIFNSPDFSLNGNTDLRVRSYDLNNFLKKLLGVFDLIEDYLKIKIIIAASGKYKYNNNPYGSREIIYNKTNPLIQHAEIVVGHSSSGLFQAIIENIPIIILNDKESLYNEKRMSINRVAKFLGLKPVELKTFNISSLDNNIVNEKRNRKLINDYFLDDRLLNTEKEYNNTIANKIKSIY